MLIEARKQNLVAFIKNAVTEIVNEKQESKMRLGCVTLITNTINPTIVIFSHLTHVLKGNNA